MKKILFVLMVILPGISFLNAQNYNWITPNKIYLKMYLAGDGLYRIDNTDFTNAGINTGNIDPRTVKVYNKGNQVPIYFFGESDGVFDNNDYFDFYGTRNYGGLTNIYDQFNALSYVVNDYYNEFSDTNIYWVDWDGVNGLRMSQSNFSTSTDYPSQFFNETIHFEKENFYSPGENIGPTDYRFLGTDKWKGEGWYWSKLQDSQTLSDTFSIPFLFSTPQTVSFKIFAYPTNRNTSVSNEHSIQIRINNNLIATIFSNDLNKIDSTVTFSSSLLSGSSANNVSIKYVLAAGAAANCLNHPCGMNVDFFEISYPKIFKFAISNFNAILPGPDTTSKLFKVAGYNSSNPVNIYDVTNRIIITNYTSNFDTLKFTGKSNAKFEIYNNIITKKPFRIKQKQVPDLLSTSNGVDYLLIYHKLFVSQAEQLRAYRNSHDGYRSFKAEIEDLYDIFNYGLENPVAVRNFVKYVYDNWQLPKIKYICLVGRASLDPKKILSSSQYYINYIPTYGYPPSDGYFANLNIGTFTYYSQIAIGRLPAYTPAEAQTMIDKTISYESQPPDVWSKVFTFITGGGNPSEQSQHQAKSNSDINGYVITPSTSGEPHKIYRNDTSGSTTFNIRDSIVNDFNRGCLVANYRGHAGSHDWEVAMTDPNTLNNGTKLPLILSLTCFTGENAQPYFRGFCEQFLYLNNKGAIGFIGTTGWSYQQQGNDLGTSIYYTIKGDTVRRTGDLLKAAHKALSRDSLLFNSRHTLNCYNLMGDPAAKLSLPTKPEFVITTSDYTLSNTFPMLNDKITLRIYPKNIGTHADSCKVRFQLKRNNQNYLSKDTVLRNYKLYDSANYTFKLDTIANYSVYVSLDNDNWHPYEDESNNNILINIPMQNIAYLPLKPVNNSIISSDSVEFVGLNPLISTSGNSIKVILQMDTMPQFTSALAQTFVNSNISGAVTKFKTTIPVLAKNKLYYWRTNSVINNDSTGWSNINTFIYNNLISESESSEKDSKEINLQNPIVKVYKIKSGQFSQYDFNNTFYRSNGIELSEYTTGLYVRSYGSNAEESSYFLVGNNSIFIDNSQNTGLSMLKVNKITGNILEYRNLKFNSSLANDTVISFLSTFTSNHYLMLLNASYTPFGAPFNQASKDRIRQFGSIYCDSIPQIGYFHTWSFIGFLGANQSQVSEEYDPCRPNPGLNAACDHWTESISSMNAVFRRVSGTVSNIIGPAQSWNYFSWGQTIVPNSSLYFDVYGIDNYEQQTLLLSDVQTYSYTDLSDIKSDIYPKLNFVAKLNIDSATGTQSSALNSIFVNYNAASELALEYNSLKISSSYRIGDPLKFSFNYHNEGYSDFSGIIVNAYKKSISDLNLILTDTVSKITKSDSLNLYTNKFQIPYFRDSMRIYIETKPKAGNNEFYTYNDRLDFSMSSVHLSNTVSVEVYSDGQILKSGDYVRKNPEIKINVSGQNNPQNLMSDTSRLTLKLNDAYVPYNRNGNASNVTNVSEKNNDNSSKSNATMLFYPVLKDGTNRLSIVYSDGSDNLDSALYDVIVSDELLIKELYNYPNPMKDQTNFIFNLAGSTTPGRFKIKVFTVSGRLINEISYSVNIGYNQIPWDGRDKDGDEVANGTYLYKLVAEDDSKVETQIQKLVVLK